MTTEESPNARTVARAALATCHPGESPVVRAARLDVYGELAGRQGDAPVQATTS